VSIFGGPSADVVISQQTWVNITAEAEKLAAMAKECAAERQALRDKNDALRARVAELEADVRDARGLLRGMIDAKDGRVARFLIERAERFIERAAGNKSPQRSEGE
jgi:cell division protein FtsB